MSQEQFRRNLRLINWLAGLNNASFFVPFAVPFWLDTGLTQQKIYLLQSVFTLVMIVLEVPTGMLADRIGRRVSLMLAGFIAACGFGAYSLANGFWQFAAAESLLAIGLSMNSGTLHSMRHESAAAIEGSHGRISAGSAHSAALLSAAICAALGGVVVKLLGFRAAMVCDALTYVGALLCAMRMVEPPRDNVKREPFKHVWTIVTAMSGLIMLLALLREATHIPVFLNARVLDLAGLPVAWLGAVFATLQLIGATAAKQGHRLETRIGERATVVLLVGLAIGSYLATGLLPVFWAPASLVGFALLYGLGTPFAIHTLNERVTSNSWRATINSCAALTERVMYLFTGPIVGTLVDRHGVQFSFVATGVGLAILLAWPAYSVLKNS